MAKAKASLKAGLDNSADKKGFSGSARHRYIGGAIKNMEKRGEISVKKRVAKPKPVKAVKVRKSPTRASSTPRAKPTSTVAHRPLPTPKPITREPERPQVPRVKLELEVKKNASMSTSVKTVYSIYNKKTGARHGTYASTKRAAVQQEANNEMYAYNHPKGIHTRNRF